MDELEQAIAQQQTKTARWASVSVVNQAPENMDTPAESRAKWSKVYALFGARGETQQDEAFAAVNMYFLKNGASPAGKYRKPIQTAGGVSVESGEVVKITGKLEGEIRQFLRGRLEDSYLLLKHNPAVRDDEDLAVMAENAGVPRDQAWLLADWLGRDCKHFVGSEATTYNYLRTSKIAAAHAKRATAGTPVDRVRENAPEAKISRSAPPRDEYNEGLF